MIRYQRQTILAEVGESGQQLINRARVLIVGAGGLGSPIALYLAGAGVGTIGIADNDCVSISNLQRQTLYTEQDEGQPKAECAARRLHLLNSGIAIKPYTERLTAENAEQIICNYDIVVDACDNMATRYLISDITAAHGIPYVYGAISEFDGQVTVFNYGERKRTLRDLWPDEQSVSQTKAAKGVMGVTPAVVGAVEASETLKIICGYGEVLAARLWMIDLKTMQTQTLELP